MSTIVSAKTPSGLELAEGGSVSGLVRRGVVPEADRGYWISAIDHDAAPDGKRHRCKRITRKPQSVAPMRTGCLEVGLVFQLEQPPIDL